MANHTLLTIEDHRDLRVHTQRGAAFGDDVMSCITVPDEFRRVQNLYPILFQRGRERDGFNAVALFGFEEGENLFLDGGRWDAAYRPLAMEIQPFLIGGAASGSDAKQVHVDLDSPRIAAGEGVRVFDEFGRPTPYLDAVAEQLGSLDIGYQRAADFFAALDRFDLFEPLTLEVTLEDGSTNRLVGFHVVDEEKVRALDSTALGELHQAGHLMPMFMAIASLANLGALIERRNRRLRHG
ncbi:SapC family protein [Sphingomonas xinjiangensis]|uniref:SapC protein n=1 Tax=Sphingomonas xinjiangensis TaxID=643568 RepID=A0A840YCD2_9SPHN|nr:SapC family protein [Sphingomonas xinjiangensis]MBB5711027.1 hypothetical protein [Sphingomonas xinjiangensis]